VTDNFLSIAFTILHEIARDPNPALTKKNPHMVLKVKFNNTDVRILGLICTVVKPKVAFHLILGNRLFKPIDLKGLCARLYLCYRTSLFL